MNKISWMLIGFTILLVTASIDGHAQTLIERKVYSVNVEKQVHVKIWLPRNFSAGNKYPVIYEMVYDHSSFIAGTVASLFNIPPCIVVQAQIEVSENYYNAPQLLGNDLKYYKFLKDELISLIEKDYSASKFRIAAGLSQGADYANYIFRNNPDLFSAYAIFAIERQIYYKLDHTEFAQKVAKPKSYFIATGNDLLERIDFAKSLYQQIGKNKTISLAMRHYDRSDHSYVILDALPDALRFIFSDFINLRRPQNETAYQYFKNLYAELTDKYGYELNFNLFTSNYLDAIHETKDITGISKLITELDTKFTALDLYNIGYVLASINKYEEAELFLKRSIDKLSGYNPRINLDAPYRALALRVYDMRGETKLAAETLQQGHEKIKATNINLLYNLGKYTIEKNYNVRMGVDALIEFKTKQAQFGSSFIKPADELHTLIARGLFQLKKQKEAKLYLNLALKENPKNPDALELRRKMN